MSRHTRLTSIIGLLILVFGTVLAACAPVPPQADAPAESAPAQEAAAEGPKRGGTITIGLNGPLTTLDPADHRSRIVETVWRNLSDGLVTRTATGDVVLELAEEATMIEPAIWEFKLKQGVLFHNGDPFTAEDVKFTFDRIIQEGAIDYPEPHTSPRKGLIIPLESVEVIDDYTVRFYFSGFWPTMMQALVHQQIIPKKYFEEVGNEGFLAHPVGLGPFKFVSGNLDETIILERFDDYYGGADDLPPVGPAFLDRVIFRILPENSTRVAALQAGEVDIIHYVPSDLIPVIEADPHLEIRTSISTTPLWMELNTTMPPFDDVRVRQALNYAVDAEKLVNALFGGNGTVLAGPLSPFNHFADQSLVPYAYDPDKARELLAEAGLQPEDISFVIDVGQAWKPVAEAVSSELRAFGVDASVRVWEGTALTDLLLAGERQATVQSFGDSMFDPVGHFEAKWHSFVPDSGNGRANYSMYSNPRVDELIEMGEIEPDPDKRREIYFEAQQLVYEDAPAIFLLVPDKFEATRKGVENWVPYPDDRLNMHDVWLSD